jgi:DNA-binding HxlR family transcriptional regulator
MEYDLKIRFEKIAESNHLKVKSKIQFLLAINNELEYKDLKKSINTSKNWLDAVLKTLSKNKVVGYNSEKNTYFLIV